MSEQDSKSWASYELPVRDLQPELANTRASAEAFGASLPESFLVDNVLWFCRLRWIIIAMLMVLGLLGRQSGLVDYFGLLQPGNWPFVAAGLLTLCNVVFLIFAQWSSSTHNVVTANLWTQIIVDLLVLTVVVHFLGSIRTYIPFTYLFHIALACIFLSRLQSLAVVAVAIAMFAACLLLEYTKTLPPVRLFSDPTLGTYLEPTSGAFVLSYFSAITVWLVIWYLASRLSLMVRQRDMELTESNRRLVMAQEERSRHMLTTTHQLKAPFAAIHANAQLLVKGHCGKLPKEAIETSRRIAARCRRLATEIQDMLQLANLSSAAQHPPISQQLDLCQTIRGCIEQIRPTAREHSVEITEDLNPATIVCVEDHIKMALINLLSNAVRYSYKGGLVSVKCGTNQDAHPFVIIADSGIGILPEKLPHIFDEHYRTKKAVQHNRESSGLGLAIVREVVERHDLHLSVTSCHEMGTTVELKFPLATPDPSNLQAKEKEKCLI